MLERVNVCESKNTTVQYLKTMILLSVVLLSVDTPVELIHF